MKAELDTAVILKILFVIAALFAGWYLCGELVFIEILRAGEWKQQTKPISLGTKQYLCAEFNISEKRLCELDVETYGPEYHKDILSYYETSSALSQEIIDQKLGRFLVRCSPPHLYSDDLELYICHYGFIENDIFGIAILYHSDGRLYDFRTGGPD